MSKSKGFGQYGRTGTISYPVHVYTRTAVMFWGVFWIPVFITLVTFLKEGPLILGLILGLIVAILYYVGCLFYANLFARNNGYLVGSIDVHKDRVDLHTLTPLGFSIGRTVSLEMSEFRGLHLKIDYDDGRFDDYIVTLKHAHGGDDVRLGEIDISGSQETASKAIQKFAEDLGLPVENPELLETVSRNGRAPVRRASMKPGQAKPVEAEPSAKPKPVVNPLKRPDDDHENYNF